MTRKIYKSYILLFIFGLAVFISCSNKNNKPIKKSNITKDTINFDKLSDTLKDVQINFKYFDLYVKSEEDPSSVEIEYKKLVGYNDYDGNIYEKRDTIVINYGMDEPGESYIYGNKVEFSNREELKNLKVKVTFYYGVSVSFIDDIPGQEVLDFNFTNELEIKDNVFLVIDDIKKNNEWFSQNKPEVKTVAYEYINDIIQENKEQYKECCPGYIEDFNKFESIKFDDLTYSDLGTTTYLSRIFIEIQGEKADGTTFKEFILD